MTAKKLYETNTKINIASELKKFSASMADPAETGDQILGSKDLQALYEISKAVNSTLILDEILSIVMKKSIELLRAERGFLMLLDAGGALQFKTAHNIKKQELTKSDLHISMTIAESVIKTGDSIYTSDAINDSRFANQRSVLEMNIRSAVCVPLKIKGQIIGVVYLDNSSKANIFLKSDLHLFELFADQASMAIQNAQLYTELFDLQRFQEAILDKTPVGIMMIDENGHLRSYNNAAFAILYKVFLLNKDIGYDAIGTSFLDLLPPNQIKFWKENIEKSSEFPVEIPSHRLKTNDEYVIIRIRFSPFHHVDESLSGRIIVLEDITERVLLEQHLVLSEKMVAKGEMAASIGHELNNYLTTILSSAQLLSRYIENNQLDKVPAKAESIVDGIDRMKRFTAGLMDYSALETKKEKHEVRTVIEDVVFFAKPQKKFCRIEIEIDVPSNVPSFMVDVGQIHQVLLNLLANSAEAINESSSAEGTIRISASQKENNIEILVGDSGPGIPDDVLRRIFQPHITSKKKGHGLGLSNSKRIINNHNGEITASNKPEGGALFTITLPLR